MRPPGAGRFATGTPVSIVTTKWGDRPHWSFPGRYLGADEHGDWVGFPTGSRFTRPGAEYVAPVGQVSLLPAPGPWVPAGWVATFHAVGGPVRVYVDVTTPSSWDGTTVRTTDLDLDVVRTLDATVLVHDEDEFAEHRVAFGYPAEIVDAARAVCAAVRAALTRGRPPFDDATPAGWLAVLEGL